MKTLYWLSLLAGTLWGSKPLYDWLILKREIHIGYQPSGFFDHIEFIFPVLCLSVLYLLGSTFKKQLTFSITILTIGLLLNSIFYYIETFHSLSSIPYGHLFLLPSTAFLFTGAVSLAFQLYKLKEVAKAVFYIGIVFSVSTGLLCLLPLAVIFLSESVVTPLTASIMTIIGFSFGSISIPFLLKNRKSKINITTEVTT
ncbi:hypothetical protein JOC85_003156 [Bacillus mesophilus]|uniref:Uncharacterized protein n=1 Tax=Bacillus mesophilus TaxID=1808955 RepID=A0A6M0Q9K0_9BACI|nr:hypothetical protein [Bacillus mesophilus]MBM7662349.1 hypothetical protein [Bacillus mesophilus]NEY73022.1 hypothetical protein [Bacillus mesophilus]